MHPSWCPCQNLDSGHWDRLTNKYKKIPSINSIFINNVNFTDFVNPDEKANKQTKKNPETRKYSKQSLIHKQWFFKFSKKFLNTSELYILSGTRIYFLMDTSMTPKEDGRM